jgi:hypothetical protein
MLPQHAQHATPDTPSTTVSVKKICVLVKTVPELRTLLALLKLALLVQVAILDTPSTTVPATKTFAIVTTVPALQTPTVPPPETLFVLPVTLNLFFPEILALWSQLSLQRR